MKNMCYLWRECPYCVAMCVPVKGWKLVCTGEWGRTCLIWKDLEVLAPPPYGKGYKAIRRER